MKRNWKNTLILNKIIDELKSLCQYQEFSPKLKKNTIKILITDNGSEFACWEKIEETINIPVYFAKPEWPWGKELIEHANKLIRQFSPRMVNLKQFNEKHDELITAYINNRPRKKHRFRTSNEKFREYSIPPRGTILNNVAFGLTTGRQSN